jgi:hypothetical protein
MCERVRFGSRGVDRVDVRPAGIITPDARRNSCRAVSRALIIAVDLRDHAVGVTTFENQEVHWTRRSRCEGAGGDMLYFFVPFRPSGQVAQSVEHVTENHGVGGSIPSLATSRINHLQTRLEEKVTKR